MIIRRLKDTNEDDQNDLDKERCILVKMRVKLRNEMNGENIYK